MVPLLTLGVPGDAVTAILLGALIIQGLQPGPLLFTKNADIVYGLFSSLLVGNVLMLLLGLLGVRLFCRVVELPKRIIIPVIVTLSIVGAYSMNNSIFDVWVCIGFGVIAASALVWMTFNLNAKYGEYGLMKVLAKRQHPRYLINRKNSRRLFSRPKKKEVRDA